MKCFNRFQVLLPRPLSGLDFLICAIFARQEQISYGMSDTLVGVKFGAGNRLPPPLSLPVSPSLSLPSPLSLVSNRNPSPETLNPKLETRNSSGGRWTAWIDNFAAVARNFTHVRIPVRNHIGVPHRITYPSPIKLHDWAVKTRGRAPLHPCEDPRPRLDRSSPNYIGAPHRFTFFWCPTHDPPIHLPITYRFTYL